MVHADAGSPIKKRKRQRPIISCTECHRRKQKCDRAQPCSNCTLRAASHLCQYDTRQQKSQTAAESGKSSPTGGGSGELVSSTDVSGTFGYVRTRGNTAVDVLEKLDLEDHVFGRDGHFDLNEHTELQAYNKIITSIPPRPYVMLLVKVFFTEVNWIYGAIHEGSFYQLLEQWYDSCVSSAPPCPAHARTGSNDKKKILSHFPTLLLQVLASALQMLPKEHYVQMAQLNLGKEDFRNLSAQYSNLACDLANLLAVGSSTLPRVQQWFLRGSWLKSEGRAVESWHALGQAIREAQELGLHKEQPRKYSGSGEDLNNIWQREIEKRVWINVYVWDRFMSMILGRPTLINDRHCTVMPPVDCNIPPDFRTPPIPRGPLDPPTPFTQRLLDYQLAYMVNEIDDMQLRSSRSMSQDFAEVDRLHEKIMAFTECFPRSLAIEDRDTSQDNSNPYLAAQAELMKCASYSLIVGLHRPLIFIRDKSRYEVVKASLRVLESQDELLSATREHHHTIYTFNFYTFDPAVLIAAVVITAPSSLEPELLDQCMTYLRKGCRRMEFLGVRVKLAAKGAAVLRLLLQKAESSIASLQLQRVTNLPTPSSDRASPPGSLLLHDMPTPSASMHRDDHFSPELAARASMSSVMTPGAGVPLAHMSTDMSAWESPSDPLPNHGPISTSLLSTVELDDLLGASAYDVGQDAMSPFAGGPQLGLADMVGDDNFWQNLLNVPFH